MTHEYKIQKIAEEKEKEERKLQKEVEAQLKEKELFANHLVYPGQSTSFAP